jgi:PQQ-dependent catabolism-associated CXXCW motif protein
MKSVIALIAAVAIQSVAIAQGTPADEDRDWGVAPTQQLRRPPYHAPTPGEIPGGRVVKTQELRAMLDVARPPLLIDVASGEGYDSIPGATRLEGAGHGTNFIDSLQALLAERLGQLSGGDRARPLVFFCVNAQCWLSYNAALRAIALGYTQVFWYRGGAEAWRAAGLPLAPVRSSPPR